VAGALAVIRYAKIHGTKHRPWLTALLARRPTKVAAIASPKPSGTVPEPRSDFNSVGSDFIGGKADKTLELNILRPFTTAMARLGETILLPCQFCQRLERREAKSMARPLTCFECRAERVRQRSQKHYRENSRRKPCSALGSGHIDFSVSAVRPARAE